MIRTAFILTLAFGLSACASPRAGICVTGAIQPITEPMIADKSVAGRKALEAAVSNNELGEKLCGWRP